ncbi:hypothetical protein VPH35_133820 [Triticum aestivum]
MASASAMGPAAMLNKEHTQSSSKPNEEFQHLHRPELLIAVARGDFNEIKRLLFLLLLLLLHKEGEGEGEDEDAAHQPVELVLHVDEKITGIKDTVVADITGAGHVAASSGDADQFLKCATLIADEASHLLGARNRKGDTPPHCAARFGNARMVSHLLALARATGNDDERVKVILRVQNNKQETVLHEAVRLEAMEIIDPQLARFPLTALVLGPLAGSQGHCPAAL